jgi:hypothetical protein
MKFKFNRDKCCQIGTDDIDSTTALIKRYVFFIVGYYIFAQKSKKINHVTITNTDLFKSAVVASIASSQYKKGSGLSPSGYGAMSLIA